MTDFYTKTCFVLKEINNEEYRWLCAETDKIEKQDSPYNETGWIIRPDIQDIIGDPPTIEDVIADAYFTIDDGFDMENLGDLLVRFLAKFKPEDVIGFTWASWPSKPLPGGYTGGAMVVTHENFDVHTPNMWLRSVRENLLNWVAAQNKPGRSE